MLHSSGQLLSHKRKHERKDSEIAYRKFKLAQQAVVNLANNEHVSTFSNICFIVVVIVALVSITTMEINHFRPECWIFCCKTDKRGPVAQSTQYD